MKVYLACTLSRELIKNPQVRNKCKFALESYENLRKGNADVEWFKSRDGFLLDSGAFTFMGNGGAGVNFFEYAREYGNFVSRNNIKDFFELDIESVVGWDEYLKINDTLIQSASRKPIPVFHKNRGKEWFVQATKQNDYVAYGGVALRRREMKKIDFDVMKWFISTAHKNGAIIHGLGFTDTQKFKSIRFDTVDSSSWKTSVAYGNISIFNVERGTITQYHPNSKGRVKRVRDNEGLSLYSFSEWCKFQKYMENK